MKKILSLVVVLSLAAYGTGDSATETSKNSITLTQEYLLGAWCHTHNETQGKIEEEHTNWEFKENGKFMQQTSKYNTKMKHRGKWKIEGNKLQIKPVFMGGPHDIVIISQDEFIHKFFVNMHLKRGECKKR